MRFLLFTFKIAYHRNLGFCCGVYLIQAHSLHDWKYVYLRSGPENANPRGYYIMILA